MRRFTPRSLGLLSLIAATVLALCAPAVQAGPVFAFSVEEIVTDRARLIQISLVIVALGIAMLWWRK